MPNPIKKSREQAHVTGRKREIRQIPSRGESPINTQRENLHLDPKHRAKIDYQLALNKALKMPGSKPEDADHQQILADMLSQPGHITYPNQSDSETQARLRRDEEEIDFAKANTVPAKKEGRGFFGRLFRRDNDG